MNINLLTSGTSLSDASMAIRIPKVIVQRRRYSLHDLWIRESKGTTTGDGLRRVFRRRHFENNLKSGSRHFENRICMKVSSPKPFIWFSMCDWQNEKSTMTPRCAMRCQKICFSSDFNAWGHAIKAIKLCSQYFTAVGCFAQFYRIISFSALRKWYSNRCFVWDLSTLVKAQCGRFSRYAQLPWQQWLLPENRMPVSQRTWTPPVEIL